METKQFVITKKIAKQGNQAMLVIPKFLQEMLKPGTLIKATIDVMST